MAGERVQVQVPTDRCGAVPLAEEQVDAVAGVQQRFGPLGVAGVGD